MCMCDRDTTEWEIGIHREWAIGREGEGERRDGQRERGGGRASQGGRETPRGLVLGRRNREQPLSLAGGQQPSCKAEVLFSINMH